MIGLTPGFEAFAATPSLGVAVFLPFIRFIGNECYAGIRNSMKTLFTILLLFSVSIADSMLLARNAGAGFIDTMEFGLHAGLRRDQIDWNIGGNLAGQYINVLSELDWEDLEIWQLGGTGKLALGSNTAAVHPYIRGSLDYGWITDGTARDSDYGGNDRTMEIARWVSDTDDDNVFDASIGLGFERKFWQESFTLGLLGGYSYHEQNLRLSNGEQRIPVNQPISGLDSTYDSKWHGPFVGIDLELRPSPRFSLLGSVQYHWSDYEGEANWNLRDDFAHPVSFRHDADNADGVVGTLRGRYLFSNNWAFDLAFVYRDFSARDGIDRTYLADGTTVDSKLNDANWQSSAINAGFTYKF